MAIAKKGSRKIVVEGGTYYWKFNEKIFVFKEAYKNDILIVDFGWFDVWLYVNDKENRPPDFEPKSITPKFVRASIQFALSNGWSKGKFKIEFKNDLYKVVP